MGSKKAPKPVIKYSPPPPPPAPPTPVPTQSLQTQAALNEVSGAQQRLNMELGAQLDRTNSEFFTGQDVRRTQATGAEQRLGIATAGEQERATTLTRGEQERLGTVTRGEQERLTQTERFTGETGLTRVRGEEERRGVVTTGEQQRETLGRSGQETRLTDLQQEMFRRYKENRDYEQAQQQYRA